MQTTNYDQAGPKPDTTGAATKTLAVNAAHLARCSRTTSTHPPKQSANGAIPQGTARTKVVRERPSCTFGIRPNLHHHARRIQGKSLVANKGI